MTSPLSPRETFQLPKIPKRLVRAAGRELSAKLVAIARHMAIQRMDPQCDKSWQKVVLSSCARIMARHQAQHVMRCVLRECDLPRRRRRAKRRRRYTRGGPFVRPRLRGQR